MLKVKNKREIILVHLSSAFFIWQEGDEISETRKQKKLKLTQQKNFIWHN